MNQIPTKDLLGEIMEDNDNIAVHNAENNVRFGIISDEKRLEAALDNLGFKQDLPKHIRHVLISAIAQFAGVNGDSSLEAQCEAMLGSIESEPD